MIETVIKSISEILTDKHGYTFVDIELEDGAQGFFPNEREYLESLFLGMEVKYRAVKIFNNRPKIIGLLPNIKTKKVEMSIGRISNHSSWELSPKNNKFYSTITLEDGTSGVVMVDSINETLSFRPGLIMSYELNEKAGTNFFVGVNLHTYDSNTTRELSIKRQTAFKAAVELLNANPHKGRWHSKESSTGLDYDSMVKDVSELTEKLLKTIQ